MSHFSMHVLIPNILNSQIGASIIAKLPRRLASRRPKSPREMVSSIIVNACTRALFTCRPDRKRDVSEAGPRLPSHNKLVLAPKGWWISLAFRSTSLAPSQICIRDAVSAGFTNYPRCRHWLTRWCPGGCRLGRYSSTHKISDDGRSVQIIMPTTIEFCQRILFDRSCHLMLISLLKADCFLRYIDF